MKRAVFKTRHYLAGRLRGVLVEAEDVAGGIAEARSDFGRVRADGLHDFAALGNHLVHGSGNVVYQDVHQQADLGRRGTAQHECTAYFVDAIVKGRGTVAALPDVPAENAFVEVRGASNVGGRHFDVADFSVGHCRWHRVSSGRAEQL